MQKGKGPSASPGLGRPQQPVPRGHTPPQTGDFPPRPGQGFPHQQMQVTPMGNVGPHGQSRMTHHQFYQGPTQSRPIRMPRHTQPNAMYASPPGGSPQMIQMMHPQGPRFIQQPFIPQVDQFPHMQLAGTQMQFGPPQQYPPFTQQQQQPYHMQPRYQMPAQQPYLLVHAPGPVPGQQQFQQPARPVEPSKPPPRKRNIIQIKDPSNNRDVTDEILSSSNKQSSGSFSGSTGTTPNTTPEMSAQSSNANTPPIVQQQSSEDLRATFAAQVAATLEGPSNPQEALTVQQAEIPAKIEESPAIKKEISKNPEKVESALENAPKLPESVQQVLEPPQVAADNAKEIEPEQDICTPTVHTDAKQECEAEPTPAEKTVDPVSIVSEKDLQTEENQAKPAKVVDAATAEAPVKQKALPEEVVPTSTDTQAVIVNGSAEHHKTEENDLEAKVDKEEISELATVPSQVPTAAENSGESSSEAQQIEDKAEVVNVSQDSSDSNKDALKPEVGKVNGIDAEPVTMKDAPTAPSKSASDATVKDMPKKKIKQKHRLKELDKRSSEKEAGMMDAYTEKPQKEEVTNSVEDETAEEPENMKEDTEDQVASEEETWEEKEEAGKLIYDRDFLLKFQFKPVCTEKPQGLPDIEVVMSQPRAPPKQGAAPQGGRMSSGVDFMLPSYLQSGGKGGQRPNQPNMSRRDRGRPPPKKVITLGAKRAPEEELKRGPNAWVRPSEKPSQDADAKTEDLYRRVRGILNKLTPQKFQTLTQQILELEIETPERLEGVIDLIFEKAISEPGFSVAYANMCRCLISKKVVVDGKDGTVTVTFRKILLNKCQKEFEKEKKDEVALHEKIDKLSNQGLSPEDLAIKKAELQLEELKTRRRTLGNIRFIGELFKLKMLTENIMHECVVKLLRSNDEESFECLCKLLFTIGKDMDHEKAKPRVDQYFHQIDKIITLKKTSSRVRFMLQDVQDLRKMNWVPRREDNNPKTIDQIHKEAADEEKKTQMLIQQSKQMQKRDRGMGGRDSPRLMAQADETWTTVGRGPRNVSVDPKKFQNIKRPAVDTENISLGPGGRGGFGAWARGSSGGSGPSSAGAASANAVVAAPPSGEQEGARPNRFSALAGETRRPSGTARQNSGGAGRQDMRSPVSGRRDFGNERERALEAARAVNQPNQQRRPSQEQESKRASPNPETQPSAPELSEEDMKRKTTAIIDEYLNIRDVKEATLCVKEMESPSVLHVFVTTTFNHTLEKRDVQRRDTGKLLHALLKDGVLTLPQYLKGLKQVLEFADDMAIDIPLIYRYLGELIGPSLLDAKLPLKQLNEAILQSFPSKRTGAKLLSEVLFAAIKDTSEHDVSELWSRSGVSVQVYFSSPEEAEEFCKDKKLEFLLKTAGPGREGVSRQHSSQIQEELRNLILKRKARNEEVCTWIDEFVDKTARTEPPFVRALVTCVCEAAIKREDNVKCKCDVELLRSRKSLLQIHIDGKLPRELHALYALQALDVQLEHPPEFLSSFFNCLYDEELISEDGFYQWESSEDAAEQKGKGLAKTCTQEFFRWLRSAQEESGEDS